MATVHPKVAWAGLVGFITSAIMYEVQKHGLYNFDGIESGFIATGASLVAGYMKKVDGEDMTDTPVEIPAPMPKRAVAANATMPSKDAEIEDLRNKDLEIPPKPAAAEGEAQQQPATQAPSAAAAIVGILFACGVALSACSSQQVQQAVAKTQQVTGAVAAACQDTLPLANSAYPIPTVGPFVAAGVMAVCATNDAVAKAAADPSTAEWLGQQSQILKDALAKATTPPAPTK